MALPEAVRLSTSGCLFAVSAYWVWGFAPIYWKQLDALPAREILALRVIGSMSFALFLVAATGQLRALREALETPRQKALLAGSALMIGCNWWLFIWAVNQGRIIDTSLGYYLNPLLNVALGLTLFRERLSRLQTLAVALAAAGVAVMAWDLGRLPWISLGLGGSFAIYGVLRKWGQVSSIGGLLVEAAVISIPATLYVAYQLQRGEGVISRLPELPPMTALLLVGSGAFTAFPLICFASAARRLPLSALGLFQYIAPSISLVVAVWMYDEPFTRTHMVTFSLIWCALALFSFDGFRRR